MHAISPHAFKLHTSQHTSSPAVVGNKPKQYLCSTYQGDVHVVDVKVEPPSCNQVGGEGWRRRKGGGWTDGMKEDIMCSMEMGRACFMNRGSAWMASAALLSSDGAQEQPLMHLCFWQTSYTVCSRYVPRCLSE